MQVGEAAGGGAATPNARSESAKPSKQKQVPKVAQVRAKVHPPGLGGEKIGLFATRTPHRPNAIGLTVARLLGVRGDTLLIGSCGRTDLPTSAVSQMYHTLRRLAALPPDTLVFPGHDYNGQRASTIGHELNHNPRLALEDHDEFVEFMTGRDIPFPANMQAAIAGNQSCS